MKVKINTQNLLNLSISGLYIISSITILQFILPSGLITKFLFLGNKLMIFISIFLIFLFILSLHFDQNFKFKKKFQFPKLQDFLLLVLPASPVIEYAIINNEYLNLSGIIYLTSTILVFIIFFSFVFPILFSYLASFSMLMFVGLALSFIILNFAKISKYYIPGETIFNFNLITQGLYIFILFLILYLLYLFNKKIAFISVVIFVFSGIAVNIHDNVLNKSAKQQKESNFKLTDFLNNKDNQITNKKNVYILIYESYANQETLNHYGFDNSEQIKFLEKNNFKIYHGIYSNSALSLGTTSRILEIDNKIDKSGRYYTSGNAFGLDIFKANGYRTSAIFKSSYFFGEWPISWDEYTPKENVTQLGGKILTKAIFEGKFRFDIFEDDYDYEEYINLKNKFLKSKQKNIFFYTHNKYPGHSQNSGKCLPNEREIYFNRVKKANTEMKNDVKNILSNNPNSIIVLLSDHGPYLTKNCTILKNYETNKIDRYDIQDRYGTFLSIHWPKDLTKIKNNLVITQDILPEILSNITNNKKIFDQLRVERKLFDNYQEIVGGVNVHDGIIVGGKDDGKPLFKVKSNN